MREVKLLEYKARACEAWDASVVLYPHAINMHNVYIFVMNWSVELHLKCLLLDRGLSEKEIRNLKHGTNELLNECKKKDQVLTELCTPDTEQCVKMLSDLSALNGGTRYPQASYGGFFRLDMHTQLKPIMDYIDSSVAEAKIIR